MIFTPAFSAYLNENYACPDHRNEESVKADWDGVYEKIKNKINKWEKSGKDKTPVADSETPQETKPAVS